jgi:hypothetical protein
VDFDEILYGVITLKLSSIIPKMVVCPPLLIFKPLGRFSENWYGGNGVKGDLDAIIIL